MKTRKLPKLPIGIQTFRLIREDGSLYVGKTEFLLKLINSSAVILSRPRRFGKSLTISTLGARDVLRQGGAFCRVRRGSVIRFFSATRLFFRNYFIALKLVIDKVIKRA